MTAVWVPDRVLCTVIPACVYYLWMAGFARYLFGVNLASPEALFNDGLTMSTLVQILITYGILFVIIYTLLFIGVKKRSQHG